MNKQFFSMNLVFLIFTMGIFNNACAQDNPTASRDDPAVPNSTPSEEIIIPFNEAIKETLQKSEIIEAYTFVKNEHKTVKDTSESSIKGFKQLKKIPRLQQPDATILKAILNEPNSYELGDEIARCGWYPDLGFVFKNADTKITVMVSTMNVCNVIKFYKGDELILVKMCAPARTPFVELAKTLFPPEYAEVPEILELPPTIMLDSNNIEMPVDSIQQDSTINQNISNENN